MSFREITMQDVPEVRRRKQTGQSARLIARDVGIDRKTLGRYIDETKASGLVVETRVTEDVARTVGASVQTRPLLHRRSSGRCWRSDASRSALGWTAPEAAAGGRARFADAREIAVSLHDAPTIRAPRGGLAQEAAHLASRRSGTRPGGRADRFR